MTNSTSEREQRLKDIRAKKLARIQQAVSRVEDKLAIDPSRNNDALRALYYLARLAKKAK